MNERALTRAELVDVLTEFLEALVHAVLYYRHVYPRQFFRLERLFGVATPRSRSPLVCDYVASHIVALRHLIARGVLERVVVALSGADSARLLERFVVDVRAISLAHAQGVNSFAPLAAVEAQLRAMLVRLSASDALLVPLPDVKRENLDELECWGGDQAICVFNLLAQCSDAHVIGSEESIAQHWVPVNAGEIDGVPLIVPFKSAQLANTIDGDDNSVECNIQLYVEENREAKKINDDDDDDDDSNISST